MIKKMSFYLFVIATVSFSYVFLVYADINWIIDPAANVGSITQKSSKADVIELFGDENVERCEISIGEGEIVEGTRIYAGTNDEFLIEWNEETNTPVRITIKKSGTKWKTQEGITIGTTLDQLEKINGKPFMVTGFGWEYEGRSVSWENGTLPTALQLEFEHKELSPSEESRVAGDRFFSSNHPVIKKKELKVRALYIRWNEEE